MRQLSGSDTFFLFSDKPGQHQHVSTLYVYDPSTTQQGNVPFEEILDHVRDRLGSSRILRQRLVDVPLNLDYPYWIEDEHFQLEFHVRHIALPQPGDWRQLCIQVSRLHSRALDMTRPVWEMYVIEGLDNIDFLPSGCFAVFTKVHHAALDDMTEQDFTTALHDLPLNPGSAEMRQRWVPEQEPGMGQLLALAWFNNTTRLLETAQSVFDRLPLIGRNPVRTDELLFSREDAAPETRFDQKLSPHRVWDARFFNLEDVERITSTVPGATLNETVLAIVAGALVRYLDHHEEAPVESMWTLLPVHIHGQSGEDLPGHRVQLTRTRLMTQIEDPLERLEAITEEVVEAWQHSIDPELITELPEVLPSTTMALAARSIAGKFGPGKSYRSNHNTVINLVPGPEQTLYLCGARLIAFTGMAILLDNLTLNHTVTTYDGKLAIAPVCDRKAMPDPATYAQFLEDSFAELLEAANSR